MRTASIVAALCMFVMLSHAAVFAASGSLTEGEKPKEGGTLADFELKLPETPAAKRYLGLPDDLRTFRVSDIKADAVLIEVFSMYCPFCQREAPVVNEMYNTLIQSDMADRLKMIGVGTGNSEYEVNVFREKFDVKIPLFDDEDFSVYDTIGQVGTPFFLLVRKDPNGKGLRIMKINEGMLSDPDAFYKEIVDMVKNLPTN